MMKSISNEKYTISIEDKINDVEVMMSDKMENIDKNIVSYTIHQDNHTIVNIVNKEIDKALRIEYSNEDSISLVYSKCFDKTYLIIYNELTEHLYFNITNMNNKCTIFKIAYTIDDIISMLDSIQLVSHIVLIIMVMLIFLVFKDTLQNIINNEMDELINQIRQLEQMN